VDKANIQFRQIKKAKCQIQYFTEKIARIYEIKGNYHPKTLPISIYSGSTIVGMPYTG